MAGAIGNIVSNAVNAYTGSSSGTTLQDFLDKFSSSAGRYVETLDPLGTFDVSITFFPSITPKEINEWDRVAGSLLNSLKSAGTSLLDNATGGLFSTLTEGGAGSVVKARSGFGEVGKHSFIEYLAQANLIRGGEQWMDPKQAACPLELQLGLYVQKVTVPNLSLGGDSKSETALGSFPVNGTYIQPSGDLVMDIVNTKASLHERIFYPWMREVSLPYWCYKTQPYTTANITIDFTKHNDVKYVFCGCRPKQINMLTATQVADSGNITREVTFAFDFMFVTSSLNVNDSWSSKLLGTASSLASGAANMMNL